MVFYRFCFVLTRNARGHVCDALLRRIKYLTTPFLNIVGEFGTELLRESYSAEFDKMSNWIEFNGIGFAAQTCRFKRNCSATREHVQNPRARSLARADLVCRLLLEKKKV